MTSQAASASLVSLIPSPSDPSNNPPPPDHSSSFGQVLQQHDSSSSSSSRKSDNNNNQTQDSNDSNSNNSASSTDDNSTPNSTTTPKHGGKHTKKSTDAKKDDTPVATLKSMLVRASVIASNAKTDGKTAIPTGDNAEQTASDTPDLSALIAQALALATNAKPAATTDATKDKTDTTQDTSSKPDTATDLTALMAQALISATAQPAAVTGKDVASTGSKSLAGFTGKEKKSASSGSEGSFLQSGANGASSASDLLSSLGLTVTNSAQGASSQTLATNADGRKSASDLLAKINGNPAGTANVEKEHNMNADQNLPALLGGTDAATTGLQHTISDMQIKLSSNNDFDHALKTVLHVASLADASQSRAATRVAIELQTPPGAVVNVYVTKSNDSWRAQLSTNDPAALTWVQDKMSSLKGTTEAGVEVKWLPPQLEATTTSSGSDANLGWDRGGQDQSPYQQDENQSRRHRQDDNPELAGANFMDTLATSGRSS